MKKLLRELASPCAVFLLSAASVIAAAPRSARADSGRLNLHLEGAVGMPVTSYLAPPGKNDHTANWAAGGWGSLDLVLFGPIALEIIGGGGKLFETYDLNPYLPGGVNPNGHFFYMGGGGLRIRLFDDRSGYHRREHGRAAGSLWVSAHVDFQHLISNQVGMDAALGYEWSVVRPFSMGVFARAMMGFNAPGRPWVPGEQQTTVVLFVGLSTTFELVGRKGMEHGPAPAVPVAVPVSVTPADTDGDGIPDGQDGCPNQPEDMDGYQDADGCPDVDNDGDGVPDANDACPNEAEDIDGFQDGDGCPDRDNDGDGIADTDDRCPMQPGVASMQGCPEPDGDNDGVPDRVDNCPTVPGTVEFQGCTERQLAVIRENRIEILEKVMFRTNSATIDRRSYPLLNNVATILNNHPEIQLVRVEGHTDATGNPSRNMTLSQRRAASVVKYLTRQGHVSATRLSGRGMGSTVPIVANATTPEELEQNRRVEFHVVANPNE